MRRLLLLLPFLATALAAQAPAPRWSLRAGLSLESFRGGSSDTTTIPGTTVDVHPSPRLAWSVGLVRTAGAWSVGLEGGYSSGALRARAPSLLVDDRSGDVRRWRAALLLSRRIASPGPTTLSAMVSPALDYWVIGELGSRATPAVHAGLLLAVPLGGRVELEHRILYGIGGSPFKRTALPPEATIRSLTTLSVGAGLRIGL